jgi:hypothetical protein
VFPAPDAAVDYREFPAMAFNGGGIAGKNRRKSITVAATLFLIAKILASEAACTPLAMVFTIFLRYFVVHFSIQCFFISG